MVVEDRENVSHVLSAPLKTSRRLRNAYSRSQKETPRKELDHAEVLRLNLVVWKICLLTVVGDDSEKISDLTAREERGKMEKETIPGLPGLKERRQSFVPPTSPLSC